MNAQAVKKFVEENQKLAVECTNLVSQCTRWEKECSLYDHDREALMDFANEADERAKDAEIRVNELEEELRRIKEKQSYKDLCETQLVIRCTSFLFNVFDRAVTISIFSFQLIFYFIMEAK